jgi:hypothetical protein
MTQLDGGLVATGDARLGSPILASQTQSPMTDRKALRARKCLQYFILVATYPFKS